MQRTPLLIIGILGAIAIGGTLLTYTGTRSAAPQTTARRETISGRTAIVYKSATCGCCGSYVTYLERNGFTVDVREGDATLDAVRTERGIPAAGLSCHTAIIGDYAVEGHVPVEAIERLLTERPAIHGIGLAGMPLGSPGMPGTKDEPFAVYAFTAGGTMTSFGAY